MAIYNDVSLDRIPPTLHPGDKEHVLIMQDKTVFHTNEYRQHMWLAQSIRKEGKRTRDLCLRLHLRDYWPDQTL